MLALFAVPSLLFNSSRLRSISNASKGILNKLRARSQQQDASYKSKQSYCQLSLRAIKNVSHIYEKRNTRWKLFSKKNQLETRRNGLPGR
jgi:hypothetical protein